MSLSAVDEDKIPSAMTPKLQVKAVGGGKNCSGAGVEEQACNTQALCCVDCLLRFQDIPQDSVCSQMFSALC